MKYDSSLLSQVIFRCKLLISKIQEFREGLIIKKILVVMGTRPEAIKLAPVIEDLKRSDWAHVKVLCTGQHQELLEQALEVFALKPDINLNLMTKNQTLASITSKMLSSVDEYLQSEKPDVVLVQGDTSTVMAVSLACFYRQIPLGHVEAGLRTGNIHLPYPEEFNRALTGLVANWHFAPTKVAKDNLVRLGVDSEKIAITGNTVIDSLNRIIQLGNREHVDVKENRRLILITAHRRENFGAPMIEICGAVRDLALRNGSVEFVWPLHPNPNVASVAQELLAGIENVTLRKSLDYVNFISVMSQCYFVMTDSGGVQEEAPSMGKPVLVLRDDTERPEGVSSGAVKLVGNNRAKICREAQDLLDNPETYKSMSTPKSLYGDGKAAQRITERLRHDLIENSHF